MATRSGNRVDSVFWLQLVLGVFLLTLGLKGIVYNDFGFFGSTRGIRGLFNRNDQTLLVLIALVQAAAGLFLLAGLFFLEGRVQFWAGLSMFVLWLIQLAYFYVLNNPFEPNFLTWLNRLSFDLVPAVGLWLIARHHA